MLPQTDLFRAGKNGYHTYRIPALVVSRRGTILAFCEERKHGSGDAGEIHLVLKRSLDGGTTWQEQQLVVADGDMTCGNPCPVVDQSDGIIWLSFCKNLGEGGEALIMEGKAARTVWITSSSDDGATWSQPLEITDDVKLASWTWYATGPCHGIQLSSGRLIMPCCHVAPLNFTRHDPYNSHLIYSDDHGGSWKAGGTVGGNVNESTVVQTTDGALHVSCRNNERARRRAYAWSYDSGETFSEQGWDETLVEPVCQASLVRFTEERRRDRNRVLFSNPACTRRENLTIRLSYDECRTWAISRVLNAGPSAYSDLCIALDMTICCLYERGEEHPHEQITFAQFDIEWLTAGRDRLGRGGA